MDAWRVSDRSHGEPLSRRSVRFPLGGRRTPRALLHLISVVPLRREIDTFCGGGLRFTRTRNGESLRSRECGIEAAGLNRQPLLNDSQKLTAFDGLGQVVVHARLEAVFAVASHHAGRECDDR